MNLSSDDVKLYTTNSSVITSGSPILLANYTTKQWKFVTRFYDVDFNSQQWCPLNKDSIRLLKQDWLEIPFIYTSKPSMILHLSLVLGRDYSKHYFWEGMFKDE